MSTYTTNYNLEKPDSGDDFKDFRSNYNSNMDIIDANLGGGGGGNVDDVLVNGVSVVDGNHDAQITSYKEVTQAEYDALPATKLTDGIAYFIKDAGGGGGGSSSHNYSTTEQVIGTWIDGKPLYEKTYVINALPSSAGYQDHSLGLSDIDVRHSFGDLKWASGTTRPFGVIGMDRNSPTSWYMQNQITYTIENNSFIRIIVGTDRSAISATITIQYTKTTD